MLCDHLEGWDREGGMEGDARGQRYGNICICITDSLCYKSDTNTPLLSNYTPIKMLTKKKGKTHAICSVLSMIRFIFIFLLKYS